MPTLKQKWLRRLYRYATIQTAARHFISELEKLPVEDRVIWIIHMLKKLDDEPEVLLAVREWLENCL